MLEIDCLNKKYGSYWALKDFSLKINNGILGLLGPNGAGKTTLLKILSTIIRPTSGKVLWNGIDIDSNPKAIQKELGYLPQDFGVYPSLSAYEFLRYIAVLKGININKNKQIINDLLEIVNLKNHSKQLLGTFSGGMKQRIGIAQALINNPKILIIDEPTVGLDPEERIVFKNMLSDIAKEKIIIFSTHIVSDVEYIADNIVVLRSGQIIANNTVKSLINSVGNIVWEADVSKIDLEVLKKKYQINRIINRNNSTTIRIISNNIPIGLNAVNVSPNLEDIYLYYLQNPYYGRM